MREKPISMRQGEALAVIDSGADTASGLLSDAMPTAARRFYRAAQSLEKLLADVKEHFPDASYYSASGTLNLMLGDSHDADERGQQDLVAYSAHKLTIEGGDW